jgi:hypothetical protein
MSVIPSWVAASIPRLMAIANPGFENPDDDYPL